MLSKRFFTVILIFVIGLIVQVIAADYPMPQPPFCKLVPPGSTWTMTIVANQGFNKADSGHARPDQADQKADSIQSAVRANQLVMEVGKNKISRGVLSFPDGQKEDYYIIDDILVQYIPDTKAVGIGAIKQEQENFETADLAHTDIAVRLKTFPNVNWLSLKSYRGVEILNKIPCYKYEISTISWETRVPLILQTWISIETGYPVQVKSNDVTMTFSQVSEFPNNVVLPENCRKAMERVAAQDTVLRAMRKQNR